MSGIQSEQVKIGESVLCLHRWPTPSSTPPTALAIVFHGFLAHGLYPTVRYAADRLHQDANMAVVSFDMKGHGSSEGLPGYLSSADEVIEDSVGVTEFVRSQWYPNVSKIFLIGSSMGGTIALLVSQRFKSVSGVVLLAPMMQLSVSSLEESLLSGLSYMIPTWAVIPSPSLDPSKQYRDETKRQECTQDKMQHGGALRIGSVTTLVQLTHSLRPSEISAPLLVMVADEDVVVKNQDMDQFMSQVGSADKTCKHYPALHGLLCEPKPLIDQIEADLIDWVQAHS